MEKIDNLQQLKKLGRIFNSDKIVTTEDLSEVLSGIAGVIKSFKAQNEKLNADTELVVEKLLSQVESEHERVMKEVTDTVEEAKAGVDKSILDAINTVTSLLQEARNAMPKDGVDGKDANEEYIISEVLNRIELPEQKEFEYDTGEDIVEKINQLPIDEKYQIDASHIKNLPTIGRGVGSQARNLFQLQDVTLNNPANNDVLKYNSTTGQWENGTGGGGGSSPLTTKGDLYTYSTEDARLPVGANGKFLKADSSTPTGLVWADGDGIGTVTDFIFTDGNGFDGTVTNSTSTPTLSLTTTVTNTQLMYSNSGAITGITGATTNGTAVTYTTSNLIGADIKASSSAGLEILSNAGTPTALFGAGGGANSTFYGGSKLDYATASTIAILDGSKNLISADTATYPSLTELSYVKGVTSAIQTQLNGKLTTTLTSAQIFVGNGSNIATGVTMSGDATISNTGALTIADNSITLAKMAGGTDGNLITYDSNGDPAYVATGTTGQVLTSNGAGSAPTFQDAAGGGMSNPMTTGGDIIYGGASGTPTRLANGTAGQVLTSAGTTAAPTWETPSGGGGPYTLVATDTTEYTTTSTSAVDMVTISGLSIPQDKTIIIYYQFKQNTASYAAVGLKLNSTIVGEAVITGGGATALGEVSPEPPQRIRFGMVQLGPRETGFSDPGSGFGTQGGTFDYPPVPLTPVSTNAQPEATITSITLRGVSYSGSNTLSIKNIKILTL